MTYVHLTLTWIGICVLGFSYAYAEEPTLPTPRETPPPFMLEQLGDVRRVVSTSSPQAQAWFDQGFNLLYGFNHEGASMSFLEATKYDPECAMAWWGVACANGPNINDPMMSPYEESAAYTAANRALELIETETSPANQALIKALEGRYVYPNPADRAELDMAYADRLRAIHAKMPYDLDLAAITAEAIMNTQPWEYWNPDGTPKGACEEFRGIVEDMIRLDPNHPAANHLYIHIMEASPTPWIAESAADRLYTLMPASGHMVHMPSHIWVQTGRYEESVECNRRGYELDDLWNSRVPETFSYRGYNAHNRHFLVYAAMLQGQREASIETAWKMRETVPEDFLRTYAPYFESAFCAPWHALIRFGEWQAVLDSPTPPDWQFVSIACRDGARAVALANMGRHEEARKAFEEFKLSAANIPEEYLLGHNPRDPFLNAMTLFTEGELLYKAGDREAGLAKLREAVIAEDALDYTEPPPVLQPVRHALGALLILDKQYVEAEQVYREDLKKHPANGWALLGLRDALAGQNRLDEAAMVDAAFRRAWKNADVMPPASCYCGVDE